MTNSDRDMSHPAVGFELTPATGLFFSLYRTSISFPSPRHLFLGGRILPPKYFGYQKVCGELRSWLNLVEDGGSHKNYISVPGTFLELEQ